jgi:hypothetical protein
MICGMNYIKHRWVGLTTLSLMPTWGFLSAAKERQLRNLLYRPMLWRWARRRRCHGSTHPCQYVDHPMCN